MPVPFLDLKAQHDSLQADIQEAIKRVIRNSSFIKGEEVAHFEENFARYLGVKHVISCANGTDALEIVMDALQIGEGDEVMVPAMSWISTSEIVATRRAKPVFVDIDPATCCMDTQVLEHHLSPQTKAVIAVHLYGHPAELTRLQAFCKKHSLYLIEDSAQAHGAEYQGQKAGSLGIAGTFSFFPSKNLGAMGDGGAIATNDPDLAKRCRRIANHGQEERHTFLVHGRNSRLDGLQAALLNVKLPHLDQWVRARNALAENYKERLHSVYALQLPLTAEGCYHGFHLFVLQTENRDGLQHYLQQNGIQTFVHYPRALPEAPVYAQEQAENFPVAMALARHGLSLPLYPELNEDQQDQVIRTLLKYFTA